jgi:hypothetical protein
MNGRVIDVSDLFDAFHASALLLWNAFGFRTDTEPSFGDLLDQLELELFLAAAAVRLKQETGIDMDPEDLAPLLHIRETSGEIKTGAAGQYSTHGFDQYDPADGIPNLVVPGNLIPRGRETVQIVLLVPDGPVPISIQDRRPVDRGI